MGAAYSKGLGGEIGRWNCYRIAWPVCTHLVYLTYLLFHLVVWGRSFGVVREVNGTRHTRPQGFFCGLGV